MKTTVKKSVVSVLALATVAFAGGALIQQTSSAKAEEAALQAWQTDVVSNFYGAACRIESTEESGLRFKAEIDRAKYEALAAASEVSVGMIIVPTDYIATAGGYTHEKLLAAYDVETGTVAKTGIIDVSYTETDIGAYEVYAASITEIKDANYTREFSGIAYVCVDGEYSYAPYNEEASSRSVYEVAKMAYNDRDNAGNSRYTKEQLGKIKTYMDGVVELVETEGKLTLNASEYYTSPFTLKESGSGDYVVDTNGNAVKSVTYNGERKAVQAFTTDGGAQVAFTKSKGMTVNADGTVTLAGYAAGHAGWNSGVCQVIGGKNSYLAFDGEYGTGTYMQFTYTGNNMPQVCLFANNIKSDITRGGSSENEGIIMLNGFVTTNTNAANETWRQYYVAWGPNRYQGTTAFSQATEYSIRRSAHPELTQAGLETAEWANVNFRYMVGSYTNADGYIVLDIALYDNDTNELYYAEAMTTTWLASKYGSGHIIAYAGVKGEGSTTTFGYSIPNGKDIIKPFALTNNLITKAAGETVKLNGKTLGYIESDEWDVSFAVTKTKAMGTERTALNATEFTVESGYFYEVKVTAISEALGTVKKYARICANDVLLFDFETGTYTIPTRYSGVTQWTDAVDEYGNNFVKMYKPSMYASATSGNASQILDIIQLLQHAGLPTDSAQSYKIYADISYLKMENGGSNWAVQLNANKWLTEKEGRYYVGEATLNSEGYFRYNITSTWLRANNEYAIDGTNNYCIWDNVYIVYNDLPTKAYEAQDFDFYAYGAPGVDSASAPLVTEAGMQLFAGAGFNRYLLFGNLENNSTHSVWLTNKALAETAITEAKKQGIDEFIIRDQTLYTLINAKNWDVGYKTDAEVMAQIETSFNRYLTWTNGDGEDMITGIDMGDEPKGERMAQYARVYRLAKQVAATKFNRADLPIYTCLLPAYAADTSLYALDGKTVAEENRFTAYREYVSTYLALSGADNFVVDVYPFVAKNSGSTKYFKEGYYATLQIVAEEAKKAGAEYGFVLQAMSETKEWRAVNAKEMELQVNSAIGFGAKELGFYRYMPTAGANDSTAYLVDANGNKQLAYDYAKTEMSQAQAMSDIILSFDYNASALYGNAEAQYYDNYTVGFTNGSLQKAEVTAYGAMTLVTELLDTEMGLYAYMLQNVLDTVYTDGEETATVSVTFEGYTKVAVIIDGVVSYQTLTNGVYTASLANGAAVYVIPLY